MTHFIVISAVTGLVAFWLSGWVYRDNRKLRWFWFFVVRAVLMAIAYLHPK